jgi:L-malate glycosyltransferase
VSRWGEVFGWVIAEAMAYGRPVVATRVGGIPEVVSEPESGLLIPRGDVAALTENVVALMDDPARRISMGKAGREKVQTCFDLQKNVAQLLESYGLPAPAVVERPR